MRERPQKINDTLFKAAGIPVVGVLVWHLSGFADAPSASADDRILDYICFVLISFCLWNGSALGHYLLRNQLYRIRQLYYRLPARYAVTIVISWTISWLTLRIWNHFIQTDRFGTQQLFEAQAIMTAISVFISSIYEIVYLNKERESDIVKMERSEKLKVQAQLDALKSQIDPHFIFNSLNTLSYLISTDPAKAKLFNDTLAKVYRYILLNKEKDLVQLREEVEFASNYFYLLKIRYQTGLSMVIKMDDIITEDYLIPPLSLQSLIENAIKHNHFSDKLPLAVEITIAEEGISVENRKNLKKFDIQSSKIGLSNLNERYSLIVNRGITIIQNTEIFSVRLPILKS
ncbi:MAG: histidine kinase [Chitinophagaceae bacterium]|nr:histidine kinase [Chitinophagaceae bacterium]